MRRNQNFSRNESGQQDRPAYRPQRIPSSGAGQWRAAPSKDQSRVSQERRRAEPPRRRER
jgi:hypothetical protein